MYTSALLSIEAKSRKKPRGIQGEKSRKDTASSENWFQQLDHKEVSPQRMGRSPEV